MSTHRKSYKSLADDDEMLEKIRNIEIAYRNHRFPYLPKRGLLSKDVVKLLRTGDYVGMVTQTQGLDISHLGMIVIENDTVYFLDASYTGKQVQLEKLTFFEYLHRIRTNEGVRIFRIVE